MIIETKHHAMINGTFKLQLNISEQHPTIPLPAGTDPGGGWGS